MLCVNSGFDMISCLQHILFAHGPWFLKKWGPLSIWNTQGMEKSHYHARAMYDRNTRHGDGFTHSNTLHEMFDWFYRTVIRRTLNIRKARESELVRAVQGVSKNKNVLGRHLQGMLEFHGGHKVGLGKAQNGSLDVLKDDLYLVLS